MRDVVTMNGIECYAEAMRDFVSVSSPFYPQLAAHYDQCFVAWAGECEQQDGEESDGAAAEGEGGAHA